MRLDTGHPDLQGGMYLVVELRRGDIAQTWAVAQSLETARERVGSLMAGAIDNLTSWWKIVEFDAPAMHLQDGTQVYVAVKVNWEEDNEIEVYGLYEQLELIPDGFRGDDDVWIDQVAYLAYGRRQVEIN